MDVVGAWVEKTAMTLSISLPASVVAFWAAAGPSRWYKRDDAFDAELRGRFEALHHAAARGELSDWPQEPQGALAYLLLTDQIPRNLYRGSAHAFATDGLALAAARGAVARGFDRRVDGPIRQFFYLPFEHREDAATQAEGLRLCEAYAAHDPQTGADTLKYAHIHAEVIARFGRFPHRNAALGRDSTPEEVASLAGGGFKG